MIARAVMSSVNVRPSDDVGPSRSSSGTDSRAGRVNAMAGAGARSVSRSTSSNCRAVNGDRPVGAEPSTLNAISPRLPPSRIAGASHRGPPRADLHQRRDDRLQPVVGDHQVRDSAGGLRAAPAQRDADVGKPDRGRAVRAVAGHRDHPAEPPVGLDDAHLLRRRAAGDHVRGRSRASSSSSVSSSSRAPVTTVVSSSPLTSLAIASPVAGWSPVIVSRRRPARPTPW
ncbi:hypothetical protein [Saccharothrix texasensis]|uniref:hypothetical protein n=1 Tax=Saccharothrix texasensis TaxID=103734 RepID=UPI001476A442|nr:hypothetical protein [Saccharothrix texasensis]